MIHRSLYGWIMDYGLWIKTPSSCEESILKGLQPFHEVTLILEGLAKHAHFGAIWDASPALGVF